MGTVVCLRCGYDLREVGKAGVCPECGMGAAVSVGERYRLGHCPPAWMRRVAAGVGFLWWSMVVMAVLPTVTGVVFYLWGMVVLGRTSVRLGRAAKEAREAWERADAAAVG